MSLIPQKLNLQNGNNIFTINNDATALQLYNKYELPNLTPSNNQVMIWGSGGVPSFTTLNSDANQIFVSSISGNDTNSGNIYSPLLTIGQALTLANSIPDSNVVVISIIGNFTENITITRSNTVLSGVENTPLSATINGQILINAVGVSSVSAVCSLTNLLINGGVTQTQSNIYPNTLSINDCIIAPPTGKTAYVSNGSTAVGTIAIADCSMTACSIYNSDLTSIQLNTSALFLTQTNILNNPLLANTTNSFITVSGSARLNLFGVLIVQGSTASTVQPIISINNSSNATSGSTISSSTIQYTSATSDAGTGLKCCIRFNNSASCNTYTLLNNLFICQGATTTNGSAGQFLVVQKAQAGSVGLSYFGNCGGSTANHFPNNGSGLSKTAFIAVS